MKEEKKDKSEEKELEGEKKEEKGNGSMANAKSWGNLAKLNSGVPSPALSVNAQEQFKAFKAAAKEKEARAAQLREAEKEKEVARAAAEKIRAKVHFFTIPIFKARGYAISCFRV